jgi:hypothetical protein
MRHHAANIGYRRAYLAAKRKFPQAALHNWVYRSIYDEAWLIYG